jgi:hypothetical protein
MMLPSEQEDVWRGAQFLAKDRATQEAFNRLEHKYTSIWRDSAPGDDNTREQAYRMLKAVSALREELAALAAEPSVTQFNRRLKRG